jgi:O-antigen ligase
MRAFPLDPTSRARWLLLLLWLATLPWLLFPEISSGLAAFCLVSLLAARLVARRWLGHWLPRTRLDVPILLFLLSAGIAQAISPAPAYGTPKLLVLFAGVYGYYLVQEWRHEARLTDWLSRALALGGGATALVGLFAVAWPERQIVDLRWLTDRLPHLTGGFSLHHNELAGTLLLLLPLAILAWRRAQKGRPFWLGNALLVASVLLLTQSRAGLLGLALLWPVGAVWGRWSLRRVAVAGAAAAIVVVALLGGLWLYSGDAPIWLGRLDALSKPGAAQATSWLVRLELWRNALQMWGDYPVLGAGLYAFEPVSRVHYPYNLVGPTFAITHAHNLWLETGATLGVPGFLALLSLWACVWSGLWRRRPVVLTARALGASASAYLLFSLFDVVSLGQKPGLLLWLLVALMAVLIGPPASVRQPFRWLAWSPLWALLVLTPLLAGNLANVALDRAVLGGASAPAGLTQARFAGDPWRQGLLAYLEGEEDAARTAWSRDPDASAVLIMQGRMAAAASDPTAAVGWYEAAIQVDAAAVMAYFWRGVTLEQLGQPEAAALSFGEAAARAPTAGLLPMWEGQIAYKWGQVLLAQERPAEAARIAREALVLEPGNPWYHELLGNALSRQGDEAGAEAAFARAASLRGAP